MCVCVSCVCILYACVLFRESPIVVKQKTREATRCLQIWKQSYLDVRKKIETSGRDARWEFDRKRLFDRSDYMAQICEDIYSIVQVRMYMLLSTMSITELTAYK